jgi:hypothetical protein
MRYATCLKGAALAASVLAAGVLMNGPASADVIISGYAAPSYDGPAYYAAPGYGYYEQGPVGSPEAAGPTAYGYGYAPTAYGYVMPATGPYAYRYARDYDRGYIPADDQSFSDRVEP